MICTFVSHCILMIKISQFLLLNWCRGCSRLHSNQKLVFVLQCGRENFFPLTFLRLFIADIAVFIFKWHAKSKFSLRWEIFQRKTVEKQNFCPCGKHSLSDADCMCMFHYNGKLVWVIYGDITKSLGPIRISFPRWLWLFVDNNTSECKEISRIMSEKFQFI